VVYEFVWSILCSVFWVLMVLDLSEYNPPYQEKEGGTDARRP
jgi:hypothetical protein